MSHLKYYNYEGYGQTAQVNAGYSQAVRVGDIIEIAGQGMNQPINYNARLLQS